VLSEEEKEKRRQYNREWRKKNRERYLRNQRRWQKENRDKCREYQRRYRAKHRGRYNKYSREKNKQLRQRIRNILGNKCVVCGYTPLPISSKKKFKGARLSCHEIHGRPHKDNPWYILNNIGDFILICEFCHRALHLYHRYKNKIEELEKYLED